MAAPGIILHSAITAIQAAAIAVFDICSDTHAIVAIDHESRADQEVYDG
jgi:hypothetical protein